jgi:hypothetical protein
MLVTTVLLSTTLQLYQSVQKQSTMSLPVSGQKKKYIQHYKQKLAKKAYTNPPLAMKVYIMKLTTMVQK